MKDEYQKNQRTPPKDKQTARCFLGAVEFACFLKQGAGRYTDSKADAIASFWIVAAALLFDILCLLSIKENNEILKDWSMDQIVIFDTIRTVFVYSMNILFTFTLCRIHQKTDNILKFVTAYNWLASFQMILLSPLLIMLALGIHTTAEMADLLILTWIYGYSILALLIKTTLKISWPMAAYLSFIFFTMEYLSSSILLG